MTPILLIIAALVAAGLLSALHLHLALRVRRVERSLAALRQELEAVRGAGGGEAEAAIPGSAPAEQAADETIGGLFERLVGGRLLIWLGGIALASAGIFLIRHSIGLITPEARMLGAALFGLLLVAAGEYARGGRLLADDPRIGQALVGAGIAVLYATAYGSYLLFGLIGSGTAAALMLLITAAALALSLRHGAPTALMGLVGGFLTPTLVGNPGAGALPVLAYLAVLDVAIFAVAWRRGWIWLAAAAVAASFAWTGYFMLEAARDALAAGVFVAILSVAASLVKSDKGRQLALMQPAIIGLAELAVMAGRWDVEREGWLLFGALAAATLPISAVRAEQRLAPPAALLLALLLIAFKSTVGPDPVTPWAAAGTVLLVTLGTVPFLKRGESERALTACLALMGPPLILRLLRPELLDRAAWGVLALGLAAAAFLLLWLLRRREQGSRAVELGRFCAGAAAALLLAGAGYDLAPRELVSGTWLVAAIGLLVAGVRLPNKPLRLAGLLLLTATIGRVFLVDAADLEGVLRILSFVALGGALIWVGRFYPKVLKAEAKGRG